MITSFRGENFFLSNFYMPAFVKVRGVIYPSSEHAFMACKSEDTVYRTQILACKTPAEAKKLGKKVRLRSDWKKIEEEVMYQCVRNKFSFSADLKHRLLATGDQELIEGNTWWDKTWGAMLEDGKWVGQNLLGKILMRIRSGFNESVT